MQDLRWARQPQIPVAIDRSNPLTVGLRNCFLGGNNYDLVTGRAYTFLNTPGRVAVRNAVGINTTAASSQILYTPSSINGRPATVISLHNIATFPTNQQAVTLGDPATTDRFGVAVGVTANSYSGVSAPGGTSSAVVAGVAGFNFVAARVDASQNITLSLNGAPFTGTGFGWTPTLTNTFFIAGRNNGSSTYDRYFTGQTVLALAYNRAITNSEIAALYANPWQIFVPQRGIIFSFPSGGITYNVNISETSAGSDSVSSLVTWLASLSEIATASDSLTTTATFPTAVSETATASDSLTTTAIFPTAVSETATVSDSPAVTVSLGVSLSETVVASDTTTFSLTLNPAVVETVTAYASASTGLVAAAAVTETTTAADTITTITTLNVGVLEAGTALDVAVTTLTMGAAVLETLATSEFTSTLVTQGVVILETATSSDSTIIRGVYQSSLSETVVAADAATSRFLWEPIDTTQTPGWSNISTTQNANWSSITTTQTANWQPVNTGS